MKVKRIFKNSSWDPRPCMECNKILKGVIAVEMEDGTFFHATCWVKTQP